MKHLNVTASVLMDVLTADNSGELDYTGIILLCSVWNVQPVRVFPEDWGQPYYNWIATIQALARHVEAAERSVGHNGSVS